MSSLFDFTGKLPQTNSEVTIFSTLQTKEQMENSLKARSENLSKIFSIKGRSADMGDKLHISEKTKSISLYAASDSFWYQDDKFFASENKKQSKKLPNEKAATEIATSFLKRSGFLLPNAAINSISFTTVAVSKAGYEKIDEYNTEVHVNFRYKLDNLPVFGPGAKSRVSLIDAKTTSGVYHFWRKAEPLKEKARLINPGSALEILYKNFRFAQLKDPAKVTVENMELGYFAMSPTAVQHYLIPVYRVRGIVSTEILPRYDFNLNIIAVKYSDDDLKAMRVSAGEPKAIVF